MVFGVARFYRNACAASTLIAIVHWSALVDIGSI